jgi:hypothetical protein
LGIRPAAYLGIFGFWANWGRERTLAAGVLSVCADIFLFLLHVDNFKTVLLFCGDGTFYFLVYVLLIDYYFFPRLGPLPT